MSTRRSTSPSRPSIARISLLCRSSTSSLRSADRLDTAAILFLPAMSTRRPRTQPRGPSREAILLLYRSRKMRFGRFSRFEIARIELFWKFSRRSRCSCSSSGHTSSWRRSRFRRSGLRCRSSAVRNTTSESAWFRIRANTMPSGGMSSDKGTRSCRGTTDSELRGSTTDCWSGTVPRKLPLVLVTPTERRLVALP